MSNPTAARNKDNYLKAKAAFNDGDVDRCVSYYAPDHQIRSRNVGPGREHIHQFLSSTRQSWPDIQITVEHAVAEDEWVMGHCLTTATHSVPVLGVAPTGRRIQATFWDRHRFNEQGQIAETWNLMDSLAIMQELGLIPARS